MEESLGSRSETPVNEPINQSSKRKRSTSHEKQSETVTMLKAMSARSEESKKLQERIAAHLDTWKAPTARERWGQWMCEAVQEIDPSVWPAFQMDCLQMVQRYQLYSERLKNPGHQLEQVGLFQQPPQQPVFQQSMYQQGFSQPTQQHHEQSRPPLQQAPFPSRVQVPSMPTTTESRPTFTVLQPVEPRASQQGATYNTTGPNTPLSSQQISWSTAGPIWGKTSTPTRPERVSAAASGLAGLSGLSGLGDTSFLKTDQLLSPTELLRGDEDKEPEDGRSNVEAD